jgi:hypothetical protein
MIKSKNVTNITNAEYRSQLINTILNSKRLSKEIYNNLSPLENLEVDSIKGISKWKSDMGTDINFSDVFCIKNFFYPCFYLIPKQFYYRAKPDIMKN